MARMTEMERWPSLWLVDRRPTEELSVGKLEP